MTVLEMNAYELTGLAGVGFYLGSYAALQTGLMRGSGYLYPLCNFLGASLVLIGLIHSFNLSSAIIQVSWIVISLIGMARLYYIRNSIRFTDKEAHFLTSKFPDMPNDLARSFLRKGQWKSGSPGTILINENEKTEYFYYLESGQAEILKGDRVYANVSNGEFIGEITCFSALPATGRAQLKTPSEFFRIKSETLRDIAPAGSALRQHFELAIADDLRDKLSKRNHFNQNEATNEVSRSKANAFEAVVSR